VQKRPRNAPPAPILAAPRPFLQENECRGAIASIILVATGITAAEVHCRSPRRHHRGKILVNAQFSREDSYRQLARAAWNG